MIADFKRRSEFKGISEVKGVVRVIVSPTKARGANPVFTQGNIQKEAGSQIYDMSRPFNSKPWGQGIKTAGRPVFKHKISLLLVVQDTARCQSDIGVRGFAGGWDGNPFPMPRGLFVLMRFDVYIHIACDIR